MIMPL